MSTFFHGEGASAYPALTPALARREFEATGGKTPDAAYGDLLVVLASLKERLGLAEDRRREKWERRTDTDMKIMRLNEEIEDISHRDRSPIDTSIMRELIEEHRSLTNELHCQDEKVEQARDHLRMLEKRIGMTQMSLSRMLRHCSPEMRGQDVG